MIRCRIVTELGLTPEEVGAMDFPFVAELLDYWLEYPPVHLLLRGFVGYKNKGDERRPDSWRAKRAEEMGDQVYRPEKETISATAEDARVASEFMTGARKLDCAPGHIQQAIERMKKGEHLAIPRP